MIVITRPRLWLWFASAVALGAFAGTVVALLVYHFLVARMVATLIERTLN